MSELLFQGKFWGMPFPKPFTNVPNKSSTTHISKHNSSGTIAQSTLYAPLLNAIIAYARMQLQAEASGICSCAIGRQGEDVIIAEYDNGNRTGVVFNKNSGLFIVGKLENSSLNPYCLGDSTGTALFFALMPVLLEESEFEEDYNTFYNLMKSNFTDLEDTYRVGYRMCDNVYRRAKMNSILNNGKKINIPSTGNITPLTPLALSSGAYNPDTVIYGDFAMFEVDKSKDADYEPIKADDFVGKYKLSERVFDDYEKSLIPKLPSWYVIPQEVENICNHINKTANLNMPIKNIMLRGPAGTGKTESVKAIAAGLHLPFMFLTCSANTEIFDLVGQILPELNSGESDKLPKFNDIMMDPEAVYSELTGVHKDMVSNQEAFELVIDKAKQNDDKKQGFKYVETPLVKALKYGYCIEIQEPSIISNPGVLVGLNGLLDKCESITLPTGEVIKRHPECVIVITTNTDYEGCKAMNQSVISRMNMVYDMEELSKRQLVSRVMNVTGYNDQTQIEQMADVILDISKKRKESFITDGSCGVREFIAWVESTMVTKKPYESALYTIIPLATADPECRAELINTCLAPRIQ